MATAGGDERRVRAWRCLGIWLGWLLALPLTAAAQSVVGAARVTTSVDVCVPIARAQFQRVLAIELGTSIEFAPDAAQESDGTVIDIGCEGAGGVTLELRDALTHKSMRRSIELPAVDEATRTRMLALEVAEFVVASWVELQLTKRPQTASATTPVPVEAAKEASRVVQARLVPAKEGRVPERDAAGGWMVAASVEAMAFSLGNGPLGQLSLHATHRPTRHVELSLVGSVARARWSVPQISPVGSALARLTSSSAKLQLSYIADLADAVELGLGGGVRLGLVHIAGESRDVVLRSRQFYAPWGGPLLSVSVCAHWDHLRLGAQLEGGYVTLRAEAAVKQGARSIPIAQVAGLWGSAGAFVGWLF